MSKGTQFAVGLLLGGLASGAAWYVLAPQRGELGTLLETNAALEAEVTKGRELKENYEKLRKEIESHEIKIAELIKMLPAEGERSKINQLVQKLAQNAGLGRMQESRGSDKPLRTQYYSEFGTTYRYLGGYHEFGRFLSYVSGFEKIINVSDFAVSRNALKNNDWTVTIDFRLSVFVYDHKADQPTLAQAAQARQAEGRP
jgi:type IV pilus assembly protein PilO